MKKVKINEEKTLFGNIATIQVTFPNFIVDLMNYGAAVTKIMLPDNNGNLGNVVLNHYNKKDYLSERTFLGATVGPYAGRIEKGLCEINGKITQLEKNENGNHLHGGSLGFDTVFWKYQVKEKEESVQIIFSHHFPEFENSYSGNLDMKVIYNIFKDFCMTIDYIGKCDKDTILNPTNHTYFNLSGNHRLSVKDHLLKIPSDKVMFLKENHLPATLESTKDTIFHLRKPTELGLVIQNEYQQIVQENGLNHPFLLDNSNEESIELFHKDSGRKLTVETDCSYVVCYTGNHFTGASPICHGGIALETQDVYVRNPEKVILKESDIFTSKTKWKFSLVK